MTAGKRRTAREMAVQMLYQSDLGGSPLSHIFSTFDLADYLARPVAARAQRSAAGAARRAGDGLAGSGGGDQAGGGGGGLAGGGSDPAGGGGGSEDEGAAETAPASVTVADRADQARQRRRVEDAFQYAQALVRGTVDHREEIDSMIRGQADNWRLERMPPVDRNILRLAIYEMLYERDTPKLVVVDEAIELAKKFGSEQSGRFVNGLLDGLLKQHHFPGSLT
jgi:transcription antitermination protein NusB